MIAQIDDLHGPGIDAVETALAQEPLASVAEQTVASFTAVSQTLSHVGDLAVNYGVGKPLVLFQSLLETYRALAAAQAAIAAKAHQILDTAEQMAAQ